MRTGLQLLIATVALAVLAGCGGSSKSEPAAAVGADFAAKALAVCDTAVKDKQGWATFPVSDFDPSKPDATKLPQVSAWLEDQVAPTFHTWLNDLKALGTPPSAPAAWNSMLAAVEKIARLNDDQIAAAKAGDTDGFATATSGLATAQDDLVSTSAAAGVPACADVHAA